MTKSEAIALLGGSVSRAAAEMGISISAVSQWPEVLSPNMEVRVHAALYRRGQSVDAKAGASAPVH